MEQHNERNASLRQENGELAEKLKKLYEQYKLREEVCGQFVARLALSVYHVFASFLRDICESLSAHRESGQAERPAAAAGGCQTPPGPGATEGVGGTPWQRERICNEQFCTMQLKCLDFLHQSFIVSFSYPAAERSSGVSKDVWTDEAAGSSPQTAGFTALLELSCTLQSSVTWPRQRLCFYSSYHCTQRSLRSFRRRYPRATRCSPPLNRRWRRWEWEVELRVICAPRDCFVSIQMTKKIKKLEKETAMYRSRWESSNKALVEMAEEVCFSSRCWLVSAAARKEDNWTALCPFPVQKSVRDHDFEALQGKVQRLERLRRALKVERNELNKKVRSLSRAPDEGAAETPVSDPGTDSPSPPPTDSLLDPSNHPVLDTVPCSQSCHGEQQLDKDTLLEGAAGPAMSTQEWRVVPLASSVAPPANKICFLC